MMMLLCRSKQSYSLLPLALLLFFLYGPILRKVKCHTSLPPVINIGAIFEVGDEQLKTTLLKAVERLNGNGILPRSRLNVSAHFVEPRDAFNGAKVACGLLANNVWAVISSRSDAMHWLVGSLAAELAIPHISVSWNHRESRSLTTRFSGFSGLGSTTTTREAHYDHEGTNNHQNQYTPQTLSKSTSTPLNNGDFATPSLPLSPSLSPLPQSSSSSSLHSQMLGDQPLSRFPSNSPLSPSISSSSSSFLSSPSTPTNKQAVKPNVNADVGSKPLLTDLNRGPASRNLNWLRRKYGSSVSNVLVKPGTSGHHQGMEPSLLDHFTQQKYLHQYPLPNTVNFYPDSGQLATAFLDFVHSRNWKSFTLIYDHFEGLVRMKDLLRISAEADRRQVKMSVIRFPVGGPGTGTGPPVAVDNSQNDPLEPDLEMIGNIPASSGGLTRGGHYHQQQPKQAHQLPIRPHRQSNIVLTSLPTSTITTSTLPTLTTFDLFSNTSSSNSLQTDFERQQSYVYKKLLKNIKKTEHNFVLYLDVERCNNFLKEAQLLQRMTEYDNFLIATMDIHLMDLSAFANTSSNITGISLLNSMSPADLEKLSDFGQHSSSFLFGETSAASSSAFNDHHLLQQQKMIHLTNSIQGSKENIKESQTPNLSGRGVLSTAEALLYDAVTALGTALNDLDRRLLPEEIVEPVLSCSSLDTRWPFGEAIVRALKGRRPVHGLSGPIAFDSRGHRVNFALDVLQLKSDGLKVVAKWTPKGGIESMANHTFYDNYKSVVAAMKNKELRITVPRNAPPYIYYKENADQLTGNDKFDGFCVELLKMIAKVFQDDWGSDFKYVIQVVGDGQYGRPNRETGDWDGMFGELMRHQADLAIADLTATYQRETAVDFTMPFMNLGIAILFKKLDVPDPELFSFLKPFSVEVWLYLASAFLGISILFWLLSRIAPDEWESPHPCEPDPLELENQFSIGNSLWFAIGSLMQQGSDLAPKAVSTRILAGFWWFFTLIIISSYTANLAASLTLSRMAPAISNVEDLAKQTQIQYGCKKDGSTYEFFAHSNHSTYQRMFNTMEANQEVYINNIDSAIERVRKGGYAYLAESSTIEYLIQRKCDLYQVGTWLDNKGYGIATPTESPYRTPISNAIVVLQDRGQLYELKKRWWEEKGGGLCQESPASSSSQELNIENVGGVFVVLGGGVAIGCLFGALEFIWKSLKVARDERDSIGKLIWLEIVRICTGGGSSRPVFTNQSSSTTTMANSSPNGGDSHPLMVMTSTTTPNGTLLSQRGKGGHLPKNASFTSSVNGTLKMGGDRSSATSVPHVSPHLYTTSSPPQGPTIATNSPALANFRYDTPSPPPPPRPFTQNHQPQNQNPHLQNPYSYQQQQPNYGSSHDSSLPLLSPSLPEKVSKKGGKKGTNSNQKNKILPEKVAPRSLSSYSTMY